ncbi:hypothetical protein NL676_005500 [Syzygium grande]|nr:hypothetical protein NL676_005500 [Syzygium grande]
MGDKFHGRKGNSLDHQLRPLTDRSVMKQLPLKECVMAHRSRALMPKMNGAKQFAETVGCKNASVVEHCALDASKDLSAGACRRS